jgi:outer membrane usher protein FimD/PapC
MNQRSIYLLISLLILSFGAAGCEFSCSTANIRNVTMSRASDEHRRPVDPTTEFTTADPIIHCVVELANAPTGTGVRAVWRVVDAEGVEAGTVIDTADIEAGSDSNMVDFTLTPNFSMPPGRYKVDIYLNVKEGKEAKPDQTAEFTIIAAGPRVARAFISTDPEGGSEQTEIPSKTPTIYCHVAMADLEPNTTVSAEWIAEDVAGDIAPNTLIDRVPVTLEGDSDVINFNLNLTNPLPPGTYRVDLYINEAAKPVSQVYFTVPENS